MQGIVYSLLDVIPVYVEFKYTRGSSYEGDLAIDLVEVSSCRPITGDQLVQLALLIIRDRIWVGGAFRAPAIEMSICM